MYVRIDCSSLVEFMFNISDIWNSFIFVKSYMLIFDSNLIFLEKYVKVRIGIVKIKILEWILKLFLND